MYYQISMKFCMNCSYLNFSWELGQKKIQVGAPSSPFCNLKSSFTMLFQWNFFMKHLCMNFSWKLKKKIENSHKCRRSFPPPKILKSPIVILFRWKFILYIFTWTYVQTIKRKCKFFKNASQFFIFFIRFLWNFVWNIYTYMNFSWE